MPNKNTSKRDAARRFTEQQMELLLTVQDMVKNEVQRQMEGMERDKS